MAKKLFVGNVPYQTTDDELRKLFEEVGTVESAVIIIDKRHNRSKGFGFVEMSTVEEAEAGIKKLNGHEYEGRPLIVSEAHPPKERAGEGTVPAANESAPAEVSVSEEAVVPEASEPAPVETPEAEVAKEPELPGKPVKVEQVEAEKPEEVN